MGNDRLDQRLADLAFLRRAIAGETNANLKLGLLRAVNALEAEPLIREAPLPAVEPETEPEPEEAIEEELPE